MIGQNCVGGGGGGRRCYALYVTRHESCHMSHDTCDRSHVKSHASPAQAMRCLCIAALAAPKAVSIAWDNVTQEVNECKLNLMLVLVTTQT